MVHGLLQRARSARTLLGGVPSSSTGSGGGVQEQADALNSPGNVNIRFVSDLIL